MFKFLHDFSHDHRAEIMQELLSFSWEIWAVGAVGGGLGWGMVSQNKKQRKSVKIFFWTMRNLESLAKKLYL